MGKLQSQNLYNGPETHVSPDLTTNSVVKESHPTGDKSVYPSYRYHATKEPVVINSPEEEPGEGWTDAPVAPEYPKMVDGKEIITSSGKTQEELDAEHAAQKAE
jgi:hypothetical protein